jgi:hypothetical protein
MYYFPSREDFSSLYRSLQEHRRLLDSLAEFAARSPDLSARELGRNRGEVLIGGDSLPKSAGSGGEEGRPDTSARTPRPPSEKS